MEGEWVIGLVVYTAAVTVSEALHRHTPARVAAAVAAGGGVAWGVGGLATLSLLDVAGLLGGLVSAEAGAAATLYAAAVVLAVALGATYGGFAASIALMGLGGVGLAAAAMDSLGRLMGGVTSTEWLAATSGLVYASLGVSLMGFAGAVAGGLARGVAERFSGATVAFE